MRFVGRAVYDQAAVYHYIASMVPAAEVNALRPAICSAFPPQTFTGSVTPVDGANWDEAIDDDLDL